MRRLPLMAIFFALLLCIITPSADAANFSNKEMMTLLEPIEHHAMIYGEGTKKVYVFVDPKCPHSRDFISMIHDNTKMRGIYRYYIFFYELKRFKSHNLIAAIYSSPAPLQKTLEVMVGEKEIALPHPAEPNIEEKIGVISRVADAIGVSKRPYLIIAKDWD